MKTLSIRYKTLYLRRNPELWFVNEMAHTVSTISLILFKASDSDGHV